MPNHRKSGSNKDLGFWLSQVLAETYTLYLQTQNFHWNVTGPHFFALHEAFEGQYTEMAAAIDEIAEQLRQLNQTSPGSFDEFSKLASFDHQSVGHADKMVQVLVAQQEALLATIGKAQQQAQQEGDEASLDLLIGRERAHRKQLWMLKSWLGG